MENKGQKYDQDKQRWDLLPFGIVKGIVSVLTFGAKKYKPNSWHNIENAEERYFAAAMRHLIAWREGEKNDPERGLSHLDHLATNIAFIKYFEENVKSK